MSPQFRRRVEFNLVKNRCPATICLMVAALSLLVVQALWPALSLWLFFNPVTWLHHPWTLLTGSLESDNPLMLVFALAWLWLVGSTLEPRFGTRTFLLLWAAAGAATGLVFYGLYLLHAQAAPLFLFVPINALTVIWGLQYRGAILCVMGIPLKGITIACLTPLFTFICYAPMGLPVAVGSLTGCALAWGWSTYRSRGYRPSNVTRIPRNRPPKTPEDSGLLGHISGSRTNRQFEDLIKRSGSDD